MAKSRKDIEKLEAAAEVFKGLGNPLRILIVDSLKDAKLRVMEISELLGYPQPIISQQLKILRSAGIVQKIRDGRSYRYTLASPHYGDILNCMRGHLGL